MSNTQDTNSKAQAETLGTSKDGAQNQASQISPAADALSDSSLDDVSGGSWPYNTFTSGVYSPSNGG
ncbi:hypothetical protein [Bradyrhizobium sp. CCGUVB14]|uniref:hypothetical protein n=1 Tax=Bradyrhizobium sp. CCGUVB14 TaxID=2949628 RepID=UPI0020B2B49D|nr:hypothetical protein [Bradyrhizobium sp. CCGUVB14]MCP3446131.1 hypothetical protein [Bradyrhizobium sp. CCGUVB14]